MSSVTSRELTTSEVTKKPQKRIVHVGTKVERNTRSSDCGPNYSGCVPVASDVDRGGGSGNGPGYQYEPVPVTGYDIYDLDRDGDGWGCD